jgi:hypothetical protein
MNNFKNYTRHLKFKGYGIKPKDRLLKMKKLKKLDFVIGIIRYPFNKILEKLNKVFYKIEQYIITK